jgi:hypothetical protein
MAMFNYTHSRRLFQGRSVVMSAGHWVGQPGRTFFDHPLCRLDGMIFGVFPKSQIGFFSRPVGNFRRFGGESISFRMTESIRAKFLPGGTGCRP